MSVNWLNIPKEIDGDYIDPGPGFCDMDNPACVAFGCYGGSACSDFCSIYIGSCWDKNCGVYLCIYGK